MEQIIPITTLLLSALLASVAARSAPRRLSGATALSLLLGVVALGLTMLPADWQTRLAIPLTFLLGTV